jgi:TPR repeat protein
LFDAILFKYEVEVQRLVLAISLCVLVSNPLFSFADDFSDGVNAAIKPDNNEAARIFRISPEEGDKNPQHSLGVMFYKGLGVKQDYWEAFKWLTLAAGQGHSRAKLDLSIMVYHNKGIPKNYIGNYK